MTNIVIKGAKENNLKNIDLVIPRNQVVCFVGVSGSGKSTLAFDIIAKEGQRQYFESLSSYARRYLQKSNRPDVDQIKGLSSTVIISQERIRGNPRSTVGTLTETYTYLRLLYSRVGWPVYDSSYFSFNHPLGACPKCKGLGRAMEIDINKLLDLTKSLNQGAIRHTDWRLGGMRWSIIKASNFFDMDKPIKAYSEAEVDQLLYSPKQPIEDKSEYKVIKWTFAGLVTYIMNRNTNIHRGPSQSDLKYFNFVACPQCHGWRLKQESLAVKINNLNIGQVANLSIVDALEFVQKVDHRNARVIKPRLLEQLQFLKDSGVGYLSLNRSTTTLSGGEAQRVKLARQLGCDLIETIYVLDEPTAGLHPRDINIITNNLKRLKDSGNTVLVVEHDEQVIMSADHIVEVGPGGGKLGGEIVFSGTKAALLASNTLTSRYLRSSRAPQAQRDPARLDKSFLPIVHATRHNLKDLTLNIPTGVLICLTGVSGSGKSSLVEELLLQHPSQVVHIGQQSIGTNQRGCLATYVGVFDEIRKVIARSCQISPALLSFNSKGGCPECKGLGHKDMDMNFLGNVRLKCDKCHGLRYRNDVLVYHYRGKNIAEVIALTAIEALKLFNDNLLINKGLNLLIEVGLDYLELGQTLDTLSGGEAQRLKLASRLQVRGEFYVLDEPTSGLHFADIEKLMKLLNRLVDNGNTVLVIEHNLSLISQADWIIDLGPEGGDKGGYLVAQGTPLQVVQVAESYTGQYLKMYLQ